MQVLYNWVLLSTDCLRSACKKLLSYRIKFLYLYTLYPIYSLFLSFKPLDCLGAGYVSNCIFLPWDWGDLGFLANFFLIWVDVRFLTESLLL